jgi:hypothetical protein
MGRTLRGFARLINPLSKIACFAIGSTDKLLTTVIYAISVERDAVDDEEAILFPCPMT